MADEELTISEKKEAVRSVVNNIEALREDFSDFVGDRSYSESHSQGPYEINIDTEGLEMAVNQQNDFLENAYYEARNHAQYAQEAAEKTHEYLSSIEYNLENMSTDMSEVNQGINDLNKFNEGILTATLVGLEIARRSSKNLGQIFKTQKKIIINQRVMVKKLTSLEETVTSVGKGIERSIQKLEQSQERFREDVLDRMSYLANNNLLIQANQRYHQALNHYKVQNYSSAIKTVRKALEEDSTHLPSLLLLGSLYTVYAQWSLSKNTFYYTSKLAENFKNWDVYEASVLGLANVEALVGNYNLSLRLIDFGVKKLRKSKRPIELLSKEYLKIVAEEISDDRKGS